MNRKYQFVRSSRDGPLSPASTKPGGAGARLSCGANVARRRLRCVVHAITIALISTLGSNAYAQLQGGVVSAGSATIDSSAGNTTINQTTPRAAINWQRFDVNPSESVNFIQPDSHSIALNRVLGSDPSNIMGTLSANGQVFLLNPHGVLFGKGAQVNVGGLVASTLGVSDSEFMAGQYRFSGDGGGSVLNQGSINADGGYVAMLGANVSNEGVISARLGTVALAAGNAVTLDLAGDGLLNVALDQGVANALVENSGRIAADGGSVLMTTQAAGTAVQSVVNNTGVVQAQTIKNRNGKIMLMGDMDSGTVNVGGTLDASAPTEGDGGFIETSAASVKTADDVAVTTRSERGKTGTWLIDPPDYTIALAGGDITGATLSAQLVTTSITISNEDGTVTTGDGDIHVNDVIDWTATAGAETTLTLLAENDVNVNAPITAVRGNLVVCCGEDVNVNAAITTTNGSVFLGAGRDINISAAMTTVDGNIAMCAGRHVNISGAVSLTEGSTADNQDLGLPIGLTILSGLNGSGPGSSSGTVSISAAVTTTEGAPTTIYYNPSSYQDGTGVFAGAIDGLAPTEIMWLYPEAEDKVFDGTTTANFIGLRGNLDGIDVALAGSGTANFNNASVGNNKPITFTGFSLDGADAGNFAFTHAEGSGLSFPENCCNFEGRTTGNILAASTSPGDTPTDDSGGSDAPTPTSPTPTSPAPSSPTPTPGGIPFPPDIRTLSTNVPQIVASTLPLVAFSPPTVPADVNLSPVGIRMPPPVELVQVDTMQPEATEPQELPRKPDRN